MPPSPPAEPTSFDMQLEEFCRRLSSTDTRVEMVAGFYSDERLAGRFKDSAENYEGRYAAFQVRPTA